MSDITIYHNPRCSKSRQTLALLQESGVEPLVVEYLKDTPDAATLKAVIDKLGITPRDLLRTKEAEYKEHGLSDKSINDDAIIQAMIESPKLIERPIVIKGNQARIGRPPEQVLEILVMATPYVLVLYYSRHGKTAEMAKLIARGIESAGLEARLRTVPEVSPVSEATAAAVPDDGAVYCTLDDLKHCSGLVLGTPDPLWQYGGPVEVFPRYHQQPLADWRADR